jgi:hypothetical protein
MDGCKIHKGSKLVPTGVLEGKPFIGSKFRFELCSSRNFRFAAIQLQFETEVSCGGAVF